MTANLKSKTTNALIWSAIQNWSIKLLSLLLFFVLARYLNPHDLGLASTVILVLSFIAVLSEQGFSNAIIQRKELQESDLNLPFAISITIAILSSCGLIIFANDIAELLKANNAENLITLSAIIPPITAATGFQIAMRRRELDFKSLTKATLIANAFSSILAIFLAIEGFGALSLVVQAIATAIISAILLWKNPIWVPSTKINTTHFHSIFTYSNHVFSSRLVDFFTLRSIDLIILSRYGLAGLGLYTVASKLYLTIRQLLADTLLDVTLSALSKISDDQSKLRQAYLRLIFISSSTTLPFFGLIAALAPEITLILFGQKWAAAGTATTWLCILGAIEVVQYFNGAILGATGNPKSVLWINVIKLISGMFVLIFADAKSLSELTMFYVLSQIILSPTGFILAIRVTNTPVRNFLSQISPGMLSTVAAFLATFLLRSQLPMIHVSIYVKTAYLGAVFCVVFFTLLWITCAHRLLDEIKYIRSNSDKKHQLNGL